MKRLFSFLLVLLTTLILAGCQKEKQKYERHIIYLNPVFSIVPTVDIRVDNKFLTREKKQELENELNRIVINLDQMFNIQFRGDNIKTQLMKVNENAGVAPVKVSSEVILVLKTAIEAAELSKPNPDSKALFDPTIAPVWDTWGFLHNYFDPLANNLLDPPSEEEVLKALSLVDYTKIEVNEENSTVYLPVKGMKIDLGGIVKGYAADKVREYLISQGIKKAIIDVGGNIHTIGTGHTKEGTDRPWRLGLQTPYANPMINRLPTTFGTYEIDGLTIVTSGVYERYIKDYDNNEYHHILDPRTGYPFDNGVVLTSIITDNSMWADALSTTIFAMGLDVGMRQIEKMDGVEAVFVVKNGDKYEVYISSGAVDYFTYNETMNNYNYIFKGVYEGA